MDASVELCRAMTNTLRNGERSARLSWELECLDQHFTYHDTMASLMADIIESEVSTQAFQPLPRFLTVSTFGLLRAILR